MKWNELTWYSKLAAGIFFLGIFPALAFYIGTQYQEVRKVIEVGEMSSIEVGSVKTLSDKTPTNLIKVSNKRDTVSLPTLSLLAPAIPEDRQLLTPGKYEVKWESQNIEMIEIVLQKEDGEVLISSGSIPASLAKYTLEIPEVSGVKGAQPKYRIVIKDSKNIEMDRTASFTIGCLACAPEGY